MKEVNKYTQRLINEWRQHGKIVLSVDFDSTLYPYPTIENHDDIERTIKLVQLAYETGAYIVIFTASPPERHEEIQAYCEKIKVPVNSINVNPIDLPYGQNGKIYYNINLCDRSGLVEALNTLEDAMYVIRGEKASKLTDGEKPYTT